MLLVATHQSLHEGNHCFGKGKKTKEKHVVDMHLCGLSFVSDHGQYHCPRSSGENTRCYLSYVFYQHILKLFKNNYFSLWYFFAGSLFITKVS